MEQDPEAKGEGNSYTTEFRQYDPRIGRWLSLDPLMAQYPMMSPYVAFNNNPIYFVDPLGLEGEDPVNVSGNKDKPGLTWKDENGNRHRWKKGDIYTDKDGNEHKFLGKGRNRSFEDSWEITKGKVQDLPEATCRPKQEGNNKVVNDIKTILEKNLRNSSNSKGAYGGVVIHTENGKTFEQVDPVTIIVWGGGEAEFRFIYPSDLGTTRTPGSDGLYWKGCMSCHSPIGAYNYAARNSRERIQGEVIASVFTMFVSGSFGATNAAKTSTSLWPAASGGRTVINGIEYTTHALERMQPVGTIMKGATSYSRGIPPSVVENAVKFGKITPGNTAAEVVRTFDNVRVITNPAGTRVISVIKIGN